MLQRLVGNQAVQRMLARRMLARQTDQSGPRDRNGVVAGADIAVDHAASLSGQPLPEGVRRSFETSLGADLSNVRLHTDSESAQAASAVGAKAYTVRQDIYFGKGEYSPNDPAGIHLLAHEVAHTRQNRGGPERLNKLEVSNPGEATEIEADRVADAMVLGASLGTDDGQTAVYRQIVPPTTPEVGTPQATTPQPARPLLGPATPPMPNLGPPGTVPPQPAAEGVPGGTISFNPVAWSIVNDQAGPAMGFTPDQTLTVGEVKNGDHGYIRIRMNATWHFGNPGQGLKPANGTSTLEFVTPFRVPKEVKDDDDKVKFSKTRPVLLFSEGSGAALDKQPTTSEDPDDQGGSVTVAPSITYQIQTANQVQGGFNVTVLFLSEGVTVAQQVAVNDAVSLSRAFTAGVHYNVQKPTPNKVMKLFHQTVKFGVDKAEPEAGELPLLQEWLNGGPYGTVPIPGPDAKQAVTSGQTEVSVVGHASKTGSREYNLVLAKNRADNVAAFLKRPDMMGGNAHLNTSSSGFDDAAAKGEAQSERYVAVFFEALVPEDTPPAANIG